MASKYTLEIITPERTVFSGEVESVILPTPDGFLSIQRMHEPMVCALSIGPLRLNLGGDEWRECTASEGFVEVRPDETIIFSQAAEWPEEIDMIRAKEAKERAEERLRQRQSYQEYMQNQIALARAMVRLRVGRQRQNLD
jgi:F-type H+-transporting ATPase subunit epsilon